MNKVKEMLKALEQDLRKDKQYSAAEKLAPIIKEAGKIDWTPCSEGNPEESGYYLTQTANGSRTEMHYSKKHDAWNSYDDLFIPDNVIEVVAWMFLPEKFVPEDETKKAGEDDEN